MKTTYVVAALTLFLVVASSAEADITSSSTGEVILDMTARGGSPFDGSVDQKGRSRRPGRCRMGQCLPRPPPWPQGSTERAGGIPRHHP